MSQLNPNDHLDERAAAEYLGGRNPISVYTMRYWRHTGCGPRYLKLGRRVFYRPQDLDAFIEASLRTSTRDVGPRPAA